MTVAPSASQDSWLEFGKAKLSGLCRELGADSTHTARALATLGKLMSPWGQTGRPDVPVWRSDITDDHSPFEVSVSVEPSRLELRMLVEAQAQNMERDAGWGAAIDLTESLAGEPGVSLRRFHATKELFSPDERITPRFALWHAAVVPRTQPTLYKLYLNPQILGSANAPGLVREALETLHVDRGWEAVQQLMAVDAAANELLYFALDLEDTAEARVKVYVAHHGVHASALNNQLLQFSNYEPGYATSLIRRLSDHDGPFQERPVLTCLGFRGSQAEPEVTLHFPVRCYADNDLLVADRLEELVVGGYGARLRRAIESYARRPLHEGRGLITYVSMRTSRLGEGARTVAYLSPEAFAVAHPLRGPLAAAPSDVRQSGIRYGSGDGNEAAPAGVESYVTQKYSELLSHPFVTNRQEKTGMADFIATVRSLSFFMTCAHDAFRIAAARASDPVLAPTIRKKYEDSAKVQQRFLLELERLERDSSAKVDFSPGHAICRDAGYALVNEVIGDVDDVKRLAVLLSLDVIARVFVQKAFESLQVPGYSDEGHAILHDQAWLALEAASLDAVRLADARKAIDIAFRSASEFASGLMQSVGRTSPLSMTAS